MGALDETIYGHERPNLEDLYTQLDAAIEAVTVLAVTAQVVLPSGLQKVSEAALARLLQLKATVNPGPEPDGVF